MLRTISAFCFCLFVSSQAHASLIVNAWETGGGNVRFEYDGSLNVADLSGGIISGSDSHVINSRSGGQFRNTFLKDNGTSIFSSTFSTTPAAWKTGFTPATTFGGTSLFFAVGGSLTVHTTDIVDDVWSGSGFMQFDGTTLAGMGVDLSVDRVWTINNTAADTITLRNFNPTSAVPEPRGLLLFCLCIVGLIGKSFLNRTRKHKQPA